MLTIMVAAQPYAVAVSGVGVNDLRPDPSPIVSSFSTDITIPQVGDEVLLEMKVSNLGMYNRKHRSNFKKKSHD